MNRLLILSQSAAEYAAVIERAELPQLEILVPGDAGGPDRLIPQCNVILGEPAGISKIIDRADNLEWVQSCWAGVENLCKPGLRRDYVLTGAKGIFGELMSEYVLTYVYALERQIFSMRDNQQKKLWQPRSYRLSGDIRLGIAGLGSIGACIARAARGFSIRVTGLNRSGAGCPDVERVFTMDDLAGFLKELDYLVLILPDTPHTRHFINAEVLRLMKPSAVLINVGRGNAVNEDDLVRALREGVIGGAVLDVFEQEPLPPESPLWHTPNVYITPHNAAVSFPENVAEIFIDNYRRFVKGEPLEHVVDFDLGY